MLLLVFWMHLTAAGGAFADTSVAFPELPILPGSKTHLVYEPVFKGNVFVYEAGRQHPVSAVLVHGIGDEGANVWGHLIPELEKRYHVVAFDLPGFGRSSKRNELYSPSMYAYFVDWAVEHYTRGPVILIGHSMGGAVALCYGARYPDRVKRMVLADVSGILHRTVFSKYLIDGSGQSSPEDKYDPQQWFNWLKRSAIEAIESPGLPRNINRILPSPTLRDSILGGEPTAIAGLALAQFDCSELIEQVQAPTLIIWGEFDDMAPLRTAKVLSARLARTTLEVIPNAGHLPMVVTPDRFNRSTLNWLTNPVVPESELPAAPSGRIVRLDGRRDVVLRGNFKAIECRRSKRIRIVDASAESIDIIGSEVTIENSSIKGSDYGLNAYGSRITLTAAEIEGDTALKVSRSELDMAGVVLRGREFAVQAQYRSDLVFSVCRVEEPSGITYHHGIRQVSYRARLQP